jgi:hypothetical protein
VCNHDNYLVFLRTICPPDSGSQTGLNGVITKESEIFTVTATRTSDPSYAKIYMYVCKVWAELNATLALRPSRSIVLPVLHHPFISPTLGTKRKTFFMGASW